MIASGELFVLNHGTEGKFKPLPAFFNMNMRVLAAGGHTAFVACEPTVRCQNKVSRQTCSVWSFKADGEAQLCDEFDLIEDDIRQIAVGEKHVLVLTHSGVVYSKGGIGTGAGHGGAKEVSDFTAVPALKGKVMKFVSAGPNFSIAITAEGDVYSWGMSFHGETALFTSVGSVPRYASTVTPFRVVEVSCGHAHVLALTERQQCISWGENTCGQLGIGQKSAPTHKPQLIEALPRITCISAGWAHSAVVDDEHKAYTWGLNSHGQLGLADTVARYAPELVPGISSVESAHASRVCTLFRTSDRWPLLCGRVPGDASKRCGEQDAQGGNYLSPVSLYLAGSDAVRSELSEIIAFDGGSVAFARSMVFRVDPKLAPVSGGTMLRVFVTGLPYEQPQKGLKVPPADEEVPVKIRLHSDSPFLDEVVPGRIVEAQVVEFASPDVTSSPLGSFTESSGATPVRIQVSIDGGLTWTARKEAIDLEHLDETTELVKSMRTKLPADVAQGLRTIKAEFDAVSRSAQMAHVSATLLWYYWPPAEPSHVEPSSAPVAGGTQLLIHCNLPRRIPTNHLTVKFVCKPLNSIDDPELEKTAPLRCDAQEIVNPDTDALEQLALAPPLEILTAGWADVSGRGVRCAAPTFHTPNARFYEYAIDLSLDGLSFFGAPSPFLVSDVHVLGLEPKMGSLVESTNVKIKTVGFIDTGIHKVRLDFKNTALESRVLPVSVDATTGEIWVAMPDLSAEIRKNVEAGADVDPVERSGVDVPLATREVDSNGGFAGLSVSVELTLNAVDYTSDHIDFTYHGAIVMGKPYVVSLPEGYVPDLPPPDPKAKPKKEEVVEPLPPPAGTKMACEVENSVPTELATIRIDLLTKLGDDEPQYLRTEDLPSKIELFLRPRTPSPPPDPKAKPDKEKEKDKDRELVDDEPQAPRDTFLFLIPAVSAESIPDGAVLFMTNFRASINGQNFVPCGEIDPMKLLPVPRERVAAASP
mmetsp:Transcript_7303/g.19982  ORF Transcript_7303/g.19982 Transcript_7303/m.19982 type:complete len:983 (-) Transcript_7303:36-2984(-)